MISSLSLSLFISDSNAVYDKEKEDYIYSFLTQRLGYNSAIACGFLANIYRESSFDPEADNGYAYGLIQWEGGRRTQLKHFCQDNGYEMSSIDAQLLFIQYELENDEAASASRILDQQNNEQGAYDAAYNICYYYERPANKVWKSNDRGEMARDEYWPIYGGDPIAHDEPYAPYPRPTSNVKIGMKGDTVRWVQYTLSHWLGYDIGSAGVDGDFGDSTETAVANFQNSQDLVPDGIVGPATRAAIIAEIDKILEPSKHNPVGYLDSAEGGAGCVTVKGWAYDVDTPNEACEIHIYMDGPSGQGKRVATGIIADQPSPDVNEVLGYPGNHRYEATISLNVTGEHTFYAHAINRGAGDRNSQLEGAHKATIQEAVSKPSVSVLKANKTSVLAGEPILFTAEADTADKLTFKAENGSKVITKDITSGKLILSFEDAGSYTAYVTASNKAGSKESAKVSFTVASELTLSIGEKYTLNFSGRNVTYKSHKTEVATVSDEGTVTAVKEGTALISVVTEDQDVIQFTVKAIRKKADGDCNADGEFNVSDVVLLQKWLRTAPGSELENWKAADLCNDDRLDVFDLIMMRRRLING